MHALTCLPISLSEIRYLFREIFSLVLQYTEGNTMLCIVIFQDQTENKQKDILSIWLKFEYQFDENLGTCKPAPPDL